MSKIDSFGGEIGPRDVVVQLMGGLGNQMFQVAAGYAVAHNRGSFLWLDDRALPILSRRRNTTSRAVEVFDFKISAHAATDDELRDLGLDWRVLPPPSPFLPQKAWAALRRGVNSVRGFGCEVIAERSLGFEPKRFDNIATDLPAYLIGYWQSVEYFNECRQELVKEFIPAESMSRGLSELRQRIESEESLVVHVRRGDLVTNRSAQAFHGLLPVAYYEDAFDSLRERMSIAQTYLFTDDPQWCSAELRHLPAVRIVDSSRFPGPSAHHLYAMSAGKAFILANSSFSWWAAWLSQAPPARVIAPSCWFSGSPHLTGPALDEWMRA